MTRTDCASIGLCLLAVVLLDVLAPRASFAEESGSAAHDGAGSKAAAEHSGSGSPSGENTAGGAGKSGPENKDSDRIDTRITVQPHGSAVRRDDAQELKAKARSSARGNLPPHRLSAPDPSGGVARNAIGMPVAPHEDPKRAFWFATRRAASRRGSGSATYPETECRFDRQSIRVEPRSD